MRLERAVMVFNILMGLCLIVVMGLFMAVLKGWVPGLGGQPEAENKNVIDYLNVSPVYAGAPGSYTAKYLESNPLSSLTDDQVRLRDYVARNRGVLYTPATESEIKMSGARGDEVIKTYLAAITAGGGSGMRELSADETEIAFRKFLSEGDSADLESILEAVRINEGVLREVEVPIEAVGLHSRFLGAMSALEENLLLMRNIDEDYVGGIIGARKVEDLVEVFRGIGFEIRELAEKHGFY